MTTLTFVTVAVIVYGMVGKHGYVRALALGGATPAGAALVLSSTVVVPTFYAAALGAVVALALRMLGNGSGPPLPRQSLPPGAALLLVFCLWSIFVTLVSPVLFDGMLVLTPGGQQIPLQAGQLSGTNVSQLIYVVLAVCIVVFVGRSPHAVPQVLGIAAGLTIVLSLWRYTNQLAGVPFPEGFFDNSPAFNYVETAPGGAIRFRGILSEPAGFAVACLAAICYMLPRSVSLRGWRRAGALFIAAAACYMGVISTSATFIIAGVIVAIIALCTFLFRFVVQRTSLGALASITACGMVIVALFVLPVVAEFVEATINEKVSSSSFDDRSGSDSVAYANFFDTFGLGAGVGSTRASSFLPGLLAASGLVGALLFAAAVVSLVRRSAAVPEYRPVIWAFVSALVVKIVSGPDLSDSSGIFWLSLGLMSHAALIADSRRAEQVAPVGSGPPVPVMSSEKSES